MVRTSRNFHSMDDTVINAVYILLFNIFLIYQAPSKGLSTATRHDRIIAHLRATRTCHTIKDLEKMLPSVASINGMQVKDYVQALMDDGKLHVEKIGSGNWYWVWAGEEKKARERIKDTLTKDLEKVQSETKAWESKIRDLKEERRAEVEAQGMQGQSAADEEVERTELVKSKEQMEKEIMELEDEVNGFIEGQGGGSVEMKEADIKRWKEEAEMWTDNIYILEEYVRKLAGGDRGTVDAVKRECYGDEYVEGEGLRELEFS